jgi:hypothetical protein
MRTGDTVALTKQHAEGIDFEFQRELLAGITDPSISNVQEGNTNFKEKYREFLNVTAVSIK